MKEEKENLEKKKVELNTGIKVKDSEISKVEIESRSNSWSN